jgi:response regulator of citrate/malate metabolism
MSEDTLAAVVDLVRGSAGDGLTAAEVGARLGMARVTARRYLEHLTGQGLTDRAPRYGGPGRPELVYRWRG